MRQYSWLVSFLIMLSSSAMAQEAMFSQYQMSPLQLNPAEVATSSDWRLMAHYRGQQMTDDIGFRSSQFSVMRPLFWGKRRYGGVGLSVLDDRAGSVDWFRFQRIGVSLAHDIPIRQRQRLSLGLQTRYQNKRITTDDLRTGSQFRPGQGFDAALASGEGDDGLQTDYFSLNAGLLWYATDRYDRRRAYAGLSVSNLNRPDDGFLLAAPLPVGLQTQGGFRWLEGARASLSPEILWTYQAGGSQLNLGSRFSYRLGKEYSGATNASYLEVVPRYTINRSASVALQWHSPMYTLGVSYDRDASFEAANNPLRSAFELVVAWRQPVTPKSRSPRHRKNRPRSARRSSTRPRSRLIRLAPQPLALMTSEASRKKKLILPTASTLPYQGSIAVQRLTLMTEFDFNQAALGATATNTLREIARFLKQQPHLRVIISGHADGVGTTAANLRISAQRAQIVRDFLVSAGIGARRVRIVAKGADEPLYPNTNEVLRAKNRRVEISFE